MICKIVVSSAVPSIHSMLMTGGQGQAGTWRKDVVAGEDDGMMMSNVDTSLDELSNDFESTPTAIEYSYDVILLLKTHQSLSVPFFLI